MSDVRVTAISHLRWSLYTLLTGEEFRAFFMLEHGLSSAMQIAAMPKPVFLEKWRTLFPGEEALGETVYRHAVARRAYVLLHRIRKVQDSEPHYRAARF